MHPGHADVLLVALALAIEQLVGPAREAGVVRIGNAEHLRDHRGRNRREPVLDRLDLALATGGGNRAFQPLLRGDARE